MKTGLKNVLAFLLSVLVGIAAGSALAVTEEVERDLYKRFHSQAPKR